MSQKLGELCELLGVKSIKTSVYHPQMDGIVERFNITLKLMICKFVHNDSCNWDKWLVYLLFAVREVPQPSMLGLGEWEWRKWGPKCNDGDKRGLLGARQ